MSYWTGTHWVADGPAAKPPPRPSRTRHVLGALAEGALLSLLVVGLVSGTAGTALAAKGGGGSSPTSSVWIEELSSGSALRAGGLSYGDPFTVGYETRERQPWAHAVCYPNATTVYRETYGDGWVWGEYFSVYPDSPMPQAFELIDPIAQNWTGGGADCTLDLVKFSGDYSRETVLATSPFTVTP